MDENYFVNYTFKDRSHSGRVAQGIMKLCLEEELFADVTISVEGREFQLHRLVLSAQSCFFRSMFTSNLKEAHNRVIVLQDVSESVFQLLVDYIYHGTVKLRADELIGKESSRTHSLAVSLHCAEDDSISVSGQNSLCHQITAACKHGGDLYVVGGSIPRRMWKCNNATVDWEWCAPLPRDRLQHTLVSVPGSQAVVEFLFIHTCHIFDMSVVSSFAVPAEMALWKSWRT